jgi:predicted DsbA family dithiol-disulfide isomerase
MIHYKQKFGPAAEQMLRDPNNRLNQRGRPMGVEFVYHTDSKVFNSRMAHQLLGFARNLGGAPLQNSLQEILFRRYFKDGEDLGRLEALAAAAAEASISPQDFARYQATLDTKSAESAELDRELAASHSTCTGVPHFTFPSGKEISGGEAVSVFARVLQQEAARMSN